MGGSAKVMYGGEHGEFLLFSESADILQIYDSKTYTK